MENIKKYLDKITRELLDKENNKTELSEAVSNVSRAQKSLLLYIN